MKKYVFKQMMLEISSARQPLNAVKFPNFAERLMIKHKGMIIIKVGKTASSSYIPPRTLKHSMNMKKN